METPRRQEAARISLEATEAKQRVECADGVARELRLGRRMREYGEKLGEISTDAWQMSLTDGVPVPTDRVFET